MRMNIHIRGLSDSDGVRDRARRRLRFALGRFVSKIARVHVTLEVINGPRGGEEKRCRLRLFLATGGEPLVVEDRDREISVAIDRAANRLGRSVARRYGRSVRRSANPR